jgi:hypothetical protein
MSVIRRFNFLGQARIDAPDLRSVDSAAAHDFDVLAGKIMTGRAPIVVKGLTIATQNTFGFPPTNLILTTAGALVLHYGATEAGTMLEVPDSQPDEQLISTNARVIGSFAAAANNYIGIDYTRVEDATSSDQTKFLSANTLSEVVQSAAKGIVLDYKIIISTTPFSLTPNVCPIAIVLTDSLGNVAAITDARNLFGRLSYGGDVPNSNSGYTWGDSTRAENANTYTGVTSSPFQGGDKEIGDLKSWMDAVMHVLWEAKSGQHWYSQTSRDNIKLACTPTVFALTGDNFDLITTPGELAWTGLEVVFENSTVNHNVIEDGSVLWSDGKCLYIDIDRSQSATALIAQVGDLTSLPAPVIPGSRIIIAWKLDGSTYIRDRSFELTRVVPAATTSALGIVKLNKVAKGGPSDPSPTVVAITANGSAVVDATLGGGASAFVGRGDGAGTGITATGGATGNGGDFTGGSTSGWGVTATGIGGYGGVRGQASDTGGAGIYGQGGANGIGGQFYGGSVSGPGIVAFSNLTGNGGTFYSGTVSGYGVSATGRGGQAAVFAQGSGASAGVYSTGGATGNGGTFYGGTVSGYGVSATGSAATAPLHLGPSAQPTGAHVVGDMYMSSSGVLFSCTSAGTPGTWVAEVLTNDSRLSDSRAPNGTATGDLAGSYPGPTIATAAVTLAKMANLAQDQFIGRVTASTGVPETATITAAARTVLDDSTVNDMLTTLGGTTYTGTGGIVRAVLPTFTNPGGDAAQFGNPAGGVTPVFLGGSNIEYNIPIVNRLVPNNIAKAWGCISYSGGAITINSGVNIDTVGFAAVGHIRVLLKSGMLSSPQMAVIVTGALTGAFQIHGWQPVDDMRFDVVAYTGVAEPVDMSTGSGSFNFAVFGNQ